MALLDDCLPPHHVHHVQTNVHYIRMSPLPVPRIDCPLIPVKVVYLRVVDEVVVAAPVVQIPTNLTHVPAPDFLVPERRSFFEMAFGQGRRAQVTPTAAIPEPSTWIAMLLGFGLIGSTLRRRRVHVA